MALRMIQYQTGECRVIDAEHMIASNFLHHSEMEYPLEDYALDCDLEASDLEQPYTVLRAIPETLPRNVIARWKAEDWDDERMTARAYTYQDAATGEPLALTEEEASRYTWGQTTDTGVGGAQAGVLG